MDDLGCVILILIVYAIVYGIWEVIVLNVGIVVVIVVVGVVWYLYSTVQRWKQDEIDEIARKAAVAKRERAEQVERERAERAEQAERERAERESVERENAKRAQLERLRMMIPTSSKNYIVGRKIVRQIRMMVVDNHVTQDEAERELLLKTEQAGGNAVINIAFRRHHGGYISIQGDAVQIN